MNQIIGRNKELNQFEQILKSKDAQLAAIYGRRRIGKTYTVQHYFAKKGFYIEVMGINKAPMQRQLQAFSDAVATAFFSGIAIQPFSSWKQAFEIFTAELHKLTHKQPIILFLDELPWLATERSLLLQELDHIWNREWCKIKNFKLILCGSAASWMLEKLINAKGGLHNRFTQIVLFKPLNLKQTQQFLLAHKIKLSNKQILDLYMIVGGIPFYLKQYQRSKSLAQNINSLCFTESGLLNQEFTRLFKALFKQSETNLTIIRAIAKNRSGLSRKSLVSKVKLKSGGTLKKRLHELEAAGFIKEYVPYGYQQRETFYRICDEYTLFYLKWIEPDNLTGHGFRNQHWQSVTKSQSWQSWAGYAFESVCLKHIDEIIQALDITGIACKIGSWRCITYKNNKRDGAQIDLLFDRDDDAINLCEIRYSGKPYIFDKQQAKALMQRMDVFQATIKTTKELFWTLITTLPTKQTVWSDEILQNIVTLEDLF